MRNIYGRNLGAQTEASRDRLEAQKKEITRRIRAQARSSTKIWT